MKLFVEIHFRACILQELFLQKDEGIALIWLFHFHYSKRGVRDTPSKSRLIQRRVLHDGRAASTWGKKSQGRNHIFFKQAAVFLSMNKRYLLAAYFKP